MKNDNKYCDLSKLIIMLDGDMESVKEMVVEFLDTIPSYFEASINAYDVGDLKTLKGTLHKLKGSISLIANDLVSDEIITLYKSTGTDASQTHIGMNNLKEWFPVLCDELQAELYKL